MVTEVPQKPSRERRPALPLLEIIDMMRTYNLSEVEVRQAVAEFVARHVGLEKSPNASSVVIKVHQGGSNGLSNSLPGPQVIGASVEV